MIPRRSNAPALEFKLNALLCALLLTCCTAQAEPLPPGTQVRGWTILSNNEDAARLTIAAALPYDINHIQLSHEVIHELREIKNRHKRTFVNRLIDAAHAAGICEVVLWDHALYDLDYYPQGFRTGPGGTLDLDNPEFWSWLKADYRAMLNRVPHADGLVLTFIETGARAERQFSRDLATNSEKLAAVVNAIAEVVIDERHLNLYARTFSYTRADYDIVLGAVRHFANLSIRLMTKEAPHDFFLTHPNDPYAGTIPRLTLIEFDAANEFNGQGVIIGTWPEYILKRWRNFARRPHIIGYTARTDRFGDTHIVGRPEEINLYTLKRGAEDTQVTAEQVYDEFVAARYGAAAMPELKPAFKAAYEIITSTLYTLGTNVANHSVLDYDNVVPLLDYSSIPSYILHVSGKWLDPPVVYIAHGVNREFHYWRDVVDHLAPPFVKAPGHPGWEEVPEVSRAHWIHPGEGMNETFLRYIVTEKDYGVARAEEALRHIEIARDALKASDYEALHRQFERTLLTARLHRATASAYFGFRVWSHGPSYRSPYVSQIIRQGLTEGRQVIGLIRAYPVMPQVGDWNWSKDADEAERYLQIRFP
jgi:hypothetical protein